MADGAPGGGKAMEPFRLAKFFSFAAFLVFVLFVPVFTGLIASHTNRVMLERSEAYARVFARNINHQVFQLFVVPTILTYGRVSLRNPAQYRRLDRIIRGLIHGLGVKSVTILEAKKNLVSYSTDHERVGGPGPPGEGYARARRGESSSVLVRRGSVFNLLPGAPPVSCELRSYIPLRAERLFGHREGEMIIGVIEVVQDLSDDYRATLRLQAMVSVTSIVFLALLFVILRYIVARADRIMLERVEERRRLEEKLHQSEKLAALGKMVASVAHEIKNPLGIVQSTAGILRKKMAAAMPGEEHLAEIIVNEAARLDGVVREFLDFARPQPMNFGRVDVNLVLDRALSFLAPELEKRQVALDRDLDAAAPAVRGDAERLYRAFLNVLMNAVQAMEDDGGGVLTVRTRTAADGVEVEVEDTGRGMDEETLAQAFVPFFTGRSRGTGLGLSIVKNIVEAHGGVIEAHSCPGEGSTFRITLRPWREPGRP